MAHIVNFTTTLGGGLRFCWRRIPLLRQLYYVVFTYDRNGARVKSVVNGAETTYFVGTHYEVTDGVVTKYYYAGAQRIAMRKDGTLNYLLGDHLGSTSLTTDASGNVVSELRYKAWGEVRYSSGSMPTAYQYTGQYSYASDFGLLFYNARWYDPYLNHFTQPDTIVPNPYNSQSYDRYSYVLNNPLRYIDPTGHKECADTDNQGNCLTSIQVLKYDIESKYKVEIKGGWDEDELIFLSDVLTKLSINAGGADNLNDVFLDGMQAHGSTADRLTLENTLGNAPPCSNGGFACWNNSDTILLSDFIFTREYQRDHSLNFLTGSNRTLDSAIQFTIIHEIAHVFADARPESVRNYQWSVKDNPLAFYRTGCGRYPRSCFEENMVSSIALYVVTSGAPNKRYQSQLNFVLRTSYYWQASP